MRIWDACSQASGFGCTFPETFGIMLDVEVLCGLNDPIVQYQKQTIEARQPAIVLSKHHQLFTGRRRQGSQLKLS